jgi:hypothetical protein
MKPHPLLAGLLALGILLPAVAIAAVAIGKPAPDFGLAEHRRRRHRESHAICAAGAGRTRCRQAVQRARVAAVRLQREVRGLGKSNGGDPSWFNPCFR